MRVRIESDDGEVLGEFVTLCPFDDIPPGVVIHDARPYVLRWDRCKPGEPPVYREPSWSIVEPLGWGRG